MDSAVSINLQIQALKAVQHSLESFATLMEFKMRSVDAKLEELVHFGFPVDIAETYERRYLAEDRTIVEGLVKTIREEHIDFFLRKEAILDEVLNTR